MKKLLVFLVLVALIAFVFSETCEECEKNCNTKYSGLFDFGKRRECIADCVLGPCLG